MSPGFLGVLIDPRVYNIVTFSKKFKDLKNLENLGKLWRKHKFYRGIMEKTRISLKNRTKYKNFFKESQENTQI